MKYILILISLAILLESCENINFNEIQEDFKTYTLNIDSLPNACDDQVSGFFMNKEIVSIGEAAHGGADFYKYRAIISRYLIEKHNFRVIAIEEGFQECYNLNLYINGKEPDLKKLLKNTNYWMTKNYDFLEFVESVKEYNSNTGSEVFFIGVDMQFLKATLDYLFDYLDSINPGLTYNRKVFSTLREKKREKIILSPEQKETMQFIEKELVKHKEMYIKKTSKMKWLLALRNIQIFYQHIDLSAYYKGMDKMGYENYRDLKMAENLLWIKNNLCIDKKVIFWAHNWHINKDEFCGLLNMGCYRPTGFHLDTSFQDRYYAIGIEFFSGVIMSYYNNKYQNILIDEPDEKKLAYYMNQIAPNNFFIDFESLSNNDYIESFISKIHSMHDIGGAYIENKSYRPYKLNKSYDALIFIQRIHPLRYIY